MNRFLAPAGDGESVVVPPLARWPAMAKANRSSLAASSLGTMRQAARAEILALAKTWMRDRGEPLPPMGDGPWIVAGHQPELFHPGVWVKNFALAGQARLTAGVSLNLIVDNDTLKSASLRVPVRGGDWPHAETVPFDRWQGEVPWEERQVADAEMFAAFGRRISEQMRAWGVRPLAERVWPLILKSQAPIGARFAAARRVVERDWGCHNLEVPLSAVCETDAFRRFAALINADASRFASVHNEVVQAYRARYHIRSTSHPVPDLATEGEWQEVPFWSWGSGDAHRARVFARGGKWRPTGKLRSRALATTLFARLLLADVFVHGIGGGKYDELTDEIIRRFFGIEPPGYAVLTATRLLPLPGYASTPADVRRLAAELRELDHNPQRFLGPEQAGMAEARQRLLAENPTTRRERRERYTQLRLALEPMRAAVSDVRRRVSGQLELARHEAKANALLRRRDYSFVLHPEKTLRPFLERWL